MTESTAPLKPEALESATRAFNMFGHNMSDNPPIAAAIRAYLASSRAEPTVKAGGKVKGLFDHEPQISDGGFGPERSLRWILEWFYKHHGLPESKAKDVATRYEAALSALAPSLPVGDDLEQRLRKPMLSEDLMVKWDALRKSIAGGNKGSGPRDIFESWIDWADEERAEAATCIAALRADNEALKTCGRAAIEAGEVMIGTLRNERDAAEAKLEQARKALADAEDTLRSVERPALRDPLYADQVEALGLRIGFGALMHSASALWRERLKADGDPVGGEFVAGPCHGTVIATLAKIRAARSLSEESGK